MADEDTRTIKGGLDRRAGGCRRARPGVVVLFSEGTFHSSGVFAGRPETTIGRHPDQLIFVEDPSLSRRHATLVFDGRSARVRDLGSHNGTYVNCARVEGEAALRPGDVIRCGNTLALVVSDVDAFDGWPNAAEAGPLLGGPSMERVRKKIEILASRGTVVLISGESGTGKEVVARLLHSQSERAGSFVPVNCAAVPESLFEAELFGSRRGAFTGSSSDRPGLMQAASGGTLFLDEIGELPLTMQPKLLRSVELGEVRALGSSKTVEVDFQLVAATNRDLDREVEGGRFREDLFHRICGTPVRLPPLRKRREDILVFTCRALAREESAAFTMTAPFLERLLLYRWPGNVRELERTLGEAMMQATLEDERLLLVSHLRPSLFAGDGDRGQLARVREAMSRAGGKVSLAAADLGIQRSQIYNLLRSHGLRAEDFR